MQPVVVHEVPQAAAQLDEGEVHALGVELVVEPLQHPCRGHVDVGDRLALQDHPRRPALPDQLAHLLAEHARVGEEQRRLPPEHEHAGVLDESRRPGCRCASPRGRTPGRAPRRAATSSAGRTAGSTARRRPRCPRGPRGRSRRRSPRARAPRPIVAPSTPGRGRAKSASDSAAAITTAASAEFGRSASRPLKNTQQQHDEAGTDDAGELRLGARLLGHGGAGAAGRHGEALEQAGGDVGRPDPDHLLVRLHLLAALGVERGGQRDRVGQRDERDARRRRRAAARRRRRRSTARRAAGSPSGRVPTVLMSRSKTAVTTVAPTTATSTAGILRVRRGSTSSTARVTTPTARAVASRWSKFVTNSPHLVDEAVGVGREAAQLGELSDDDGDGQAVHVADLDLARQQVGDEPELADTETDLDQADEDGQHPGEGDGGRRVVTRHDERGDGGEDQRAE